MDWNWQPLYGPYTRDEAIARLKATLQHGEPMIAAGAGTGISAKFVEKGGADLIVDLQCWTLPHGRPWIHSGVDRVQ